MGRVSPRHRRMEINPLAMALERLLSALERDERPATRKPAPAPAKPQAPPARQPSSPPGKRFLDAFGAQGGVWFAEGKTFEQAQALHLAELKAENEGLRNSLAHVATCSAEPTARELVNSLGPSLGKFAAGIKFAKKKSK
jgi:hypothetical protein